MTKDWACVANVWLVGGVRTHLMLSLGSLIRTLFFDLALMGGVGVVASDASLIPQRNAFANAGGGNVGAVHIARDVMDRICSHIGTLLDRLHIVVSQQRFYFLSGREEYPL